MGHTANPIRLSRLDAESSRILAGDDCVGDVFAYDDILRPGNRLFSAHLLDDARGARRLHDRRLVRATAQRMFNTFRWR